MIYTESSLVCNQCKGVIATNFRSGDLQVINLDDDRIQDILNVLYTHPHIGPYAQSQTHNISKMNS